MRPSTSRNDPAEIRGQIRQEDRSLTWRGEARTEATMPADANIKTELGEFGLGRSVWQRICGQ